MASKTARIVMMLLTIFLASIALPEFYRTSFRRNVPHVLINYSEISDHFLISGLDGRGEYRDESGNKYTQKEIEKLLPTAAMAQLMKSGEFPDSIKGIAVTPKLLASNSYQHYIRLAKRDRDYNMYPLTSGSSEFVGFVYTNEMMRVNKNGIEFVNMVTNSVNKEKSALFDAELRSLGYAPPAKELYGVYAASKYRDDGLFFVDQNDRLYQVRFFDNKPLCDEIKLPEGFKVRRMECQSSHPTTIAYLFGDKDVYVLTVDKQLINLGLDEFDYEQVTSFDVVGNLFYHLVGISKEGYEKLYIFNKEDFSPVTSHAVAFDKYEDTMSGKVESFIFPFVTTTQSYLTGFKYDTSFSSIVKFIWFNLALAILLVYIKHRNRLNIKSTSNMIDIAIVVLFGIYGFVAAFIYPKRK